MNPELKELLTTLSVSLMIGAAMGVTIVKLRPEWMKRWTKFCLNGQWKLFALGAVMFGGMAIGQWFAGRPYFAGLSLLMFLLEVVALVKYGFKPLTPEMERAIDESKPTMFWKLR